MMYQSTRDPSHKKYSAAEVIKMGLAPDGGLYMPEYIPTLTEEELAKTSDMKEFFYNMCMRFPTSVLIFLSNDMNSSVFLGGREWNWSDMDD